MIYNRDPVTPFELADNQRDSYSLPWSLPGESMTIDDHVANMEYINWCMLAKVHNNIKKSQVTQQKYYKMKTFRNACSVGDNILKKNLAGESYKAKMKWMGTYTIVEVTAMGGILTQGQTCAYSKFTFLPKTGQVVLPGNDCSSRWWWRPYLVHIPV